VPCASVRREHGDADEKGYANGQDGGGGRALPRRRADG
jgi:hypothetical protein